MENSVNPISEPVEATTPHPPEAYQIVLRRSTLALRLRGFIFAVHRRQVPNDVD
jgi:hypothetical protein